MWISLGRSLSKNKRLALAASVREKGSRASVTVQLQLEDQRQRLQTRIDNWMRRGERYLAGNDELWPDVGEDAAEQFGGHSAELNMDVGEEWDSLNLDHPEDTALESIFQDDPAEEGIMNAEQFVLFFPSTLGVAQCKARGLGEMVTQELELRCGQANDALHVIRLALGYKGFLFRHSVRAADTHKEKLRSFDEVSTVEKTVKQQARIYGCAQRAMIDLGATEHIMKRYPPLKREDLKVTTALIHPNAHGVAGAELSWI